MGFLENTLGDSPIVAAVKDEPGLERCLNSPCRVVFVLFGDLNSVPRIVAELKTAGKTVFVHADLIEGLSAREAAVDYLIHAARPDGIISTRLPLLRFAKAKGLRTILRFFLIDSIAMENIAKMKNERCGFDRGAARAYAKGDSSGGSHLWQAHYRRGIGDGKGRCGQRPGGGRTGGVLHQSGGLENVR